MGMASALNFPCMSRVERAHTYILQKVNQNMRNHSQTTKTAPDPMIAASHGALEPRVGPPSVVGQERPQPPNISVLHDNIHVSGADLHPAKLLQDEKENRKMVLRDKRASAADAGSWEDKMHPDVDVTMMLFHNASHRSFLQDPCYRGH